MNRLRRAISVYWMCIERSVRAERVHSNGCSVAQRQFETASEDSYPVRMCCGHDLRNVAEWCYLNLSSPPRAKAILSKLLRNGNATGK
jgi:hypothetical protein